MAKLYLLRYLRTFADLHPQKPANGYADTLEKVTPLGIDVKFQGLVKHKTSPTNVQPGKEPWLPRVPSHWRWSPVDNGSPHLCSSPLQKRGVHQQTQKPIGGNTKNLKNVCVCFLWCSCWNFWGSDSRFDQRRPVFRVFCKAISGIQSFFRFSWKKSSSIANRWCFPPKTNTQNKELSRRFTNQVLRDITRWHSNSSLIKPFHEDVETTLVSCSQRIDISNP